MKPPPPQIVEEMRKKGFLSARSAALRSGLAIQTIYRLTETKTDNPNEKPRVRGLKVGDWHFVSVPDLAAYIGKIIANAGCLTVNLNGEAISDEQYERRRSAPPRGR
jgi:hypothetical protein